MEHLLRAALLSWLKSGPAPLTAFNGFTEERPQKSAPPWLGISASASADWSTKDKQGREVRIALELLSHADDAATEAAFIQAITSRLEDIPRLQTTYKIVSITFLRSRSERRAKNARSTLLEYRFRCLAN